MLTERFIIKGTVQGVGFRAFTREVAIAAGLTGYVKNLKDGTVECVASGSGDALERLYLALTRGPAGASVSSVERSQSGKSTGEGFVIAH